MAGVVKRVLGGLDPLHGGERTLSRLVDRRVTERASLVSATLKPACAS